MTTLAMVQVVLWTLAVAADAARLLTLPASACPWQRDGFAQRACALAADSVTWAAALADGPTAAGRRSAHMCPRVLRCTQHDEFSTTVKDLPILLEACVRACSACDKVKQTVPVLRGGYLHARRPRGCKLSGSIGHGPRSPPGYELAGHASRADCCSR